MGSGFNEEADRPDYDNLAALAENIVYRVPGCTDLMVRKAIAETYRDFCKRTCVIRTRRRIEIRHGENDYCLHPKFPECIVDCVVGAYVGGRRVDLEGYAAWNGDAVHLDGRMLPPEGETAMMDVECVEVPRIGSEHAPRLFIERYGDAIVSGALYRLMSMSGRAWSDPQQAMLEARLYENELTEHRTRHHSGGNLSTGSANFISGGTII